MAMATQGQADHDHPLHHDHPGAAGTASSSIATNRWGPYSGAGDFASNMAVILAALLSALALGLALNAAVRYLLRRGRRAARPGEGNNNNSGGSSRVSEDNDPEKLAVENSPPPPPPPALLVYSAAGTKLAGAAAECAICLVEFVDGDAVRVMPACGHGFHARCIERWLAVAGGHGRRSSSCPTCRAPAAVVGVEAAPQQPAVS